jgi:hypothetical protein
MKKLFALFFFIFLISFASAFELSISPPQIDFNLTANHESCSQINVYLEKPDTLIGADKWAQKGITERKFSLHTLSSKDLGLKVNYPKRLQAQNLTKINVCISAKNAGFYHGLLLYKTESSKSGVGIWINLNVTNSEIFSIKKLTGNVINQQNTYSKIILSMLAFYSAIILILLTIKYHRHKRKLI